MNRRQITLSILKKTIFYLLLASFIALSIRHQYLLLSYREWGDESETIVAAKMMASGMKLYSEIFNHHGPLTFLPGVLTEKFGNFGVVGHRIFISALQIASILAIYTSPIFKSKWVRLLASVTSATFILSYLPDIFGHMYKYQTITGILIAIILVQYTIPSIFCPEKIKSHQILLGNALISSLPFLAITYLPISASLFIASFRPKKYKVCLAGSASGLIGNLIFLGAYGSIPGFLAFHVYLNSKILPLYTAQEVGWPLIANAFNTLTGDLNHFLSLLFILTGSLALAQQEKRFPWRTIILDGGIISLLVRGSGFHGMPFFYAILPFIVLTLSTINISNKSIKIVAIALIVLCMLKISFILGDKRKITSSAIPSSTEFSRLVKKITEPEDKIIVYSFNNFEYLASDRLPASGHFFYLPWQEKYNLSPKLGISINACKQIKEVAPKIMYIDKWKVWNAYPWDSYAGCVQELIDSNYHQINPGKPYYIRKDLLQNSEISRAIAESF